MTGRREGFTNRVVVRSARDASPPVARAAVAGFAWSFVLAACAALTFAADAAAQGAGPYYDDDSVLIDLSVIDDGGLGRRQAPLPAAGVVPRLGGALQMPGLEMPRSRFHGLGSPSGQATAQLARPPAAKSRPATAPRTAAAAPTRPPVEKRAAAVQPPPPPSGIPAQPPAPPVVAAMPAPSPSPPPAPAAAPAPQTAAPAPRSMAPPGAHAPKPLDPAASAPRP
ncbi:MAG: hypothetical protein AAB223_07395 [Pseudomonadota bacterium]